ncbi:MAG: DNA primase [Armatimonas sp.]
MEDGEKEEIRRRIDIVELISAYTPLKKTGGKYKGLCPFHQEKTPSFNVDPISGRWHCFGGCGEGGDIFKFLMKAEGLTFPEAVEKLATRAGVTLVRRGMDKEASARLSNEKDRLYNANAIAARFFAECLRRDSGPRDYCNRRKLTHETIEAFQVGWAPDDWSQLANYLQRNGIRADDAEKAGLIRPNSRGDGYTDKFRARLMFPIVDAQERIVAFGGRLIENIEGAPKYLNSPETPVFSKSSILYALNRARKAIQADDRVLVVEGYMDAVACHQAGIENVVATLGTSLTERHVEVLRRYTKTVILCFDADAAGERAALRAADLFRSAGQEFTLKVLVLPPGDDPDSMLSRGDAPAFRRAFDSALTVPEFQLQAMQPRFDLKEESGRIEYLRAAIPILAGIPSSLERDRLIRKLSPNHPSYVSGGSRAEESIREEIRRHQPFGPRDADNFFDGQAAPRPQNQQQQRRPYNGNSGNSSYQGNGNGNGSYGNRNGSQGNWKNRYAPQLPTPPPEAGKVTRSAVAVAEETLLRALLSDEWSVFTARRMESASARELLSNPRAVELLEELQPLLVGHIMPSQAVNQLRNETLADFATVYLMGEFSEPLSEDAIDGCIERLVKNRVQQETRAVVNTTEKLDDEALRRWSQGTKAVKNDPEAS